jgi:hypothetical protein
MAKFKKKEPAQQKSSSILNDPEQRKKFKSALATVTHYFQQSDDAKEGAKETVAELSSEYGLDKKTIGKIAKTMYKHNYGSLLEENRHFETLYESIIEGKLRDETSDPLERAIKQAESDDE